MTDVTPRHPLTPRPTIYRGVQMRSRLEAAWAEQFDALRWKWEYEPFAVADQSGQYLPDFKLTIHGRPVFAEVKPAPFADPECRGLVGIDPDLWNAAWTSFDDDVHKMSGAVRANAECAAFIVCIGSNAEGRVAIYADTPRPENHTRHTMVVPTVCLSDIPSLRCVGLTREPYQTGCRIHGAPWIPIRPVDSLYAPNGFEWYPAPLKVRDDFDELIRGAE